MRSRERIYGGTVVILLQSSGRNMNIVLCMAPYLAISPWLLLRSFKAVLGTDCSHKMHVWGCFGVYENLGTTTTTDGKVLSISKKGV